MPADDAANLTLEVLKSIREEIVGLRVDTGELREEVIGLRRDTNARLETLEVRFGRVDQGLVDLGKFMREIALDMSRYEQFHAHHVELIEKDVEDLKLRMRRVEDRGSGG